MKAQPPNRASLAWILLLAICLLCVPVELAQTDNSVQPGTSDQSSAAKQDQSNSSDKPEQKSSESATTKLRIIVTTEKISPSATPAST